MTDDIKPPSLLHVPPIPPVPRDERLQNVLHPDAVRPVDKDEQRQTDDRFRKELARLAEQEEDRGKHQEMHARHHQPQDDAANVGQPNDEPPGVGQNLDVRT
jgi:hypothetical protein